MAGFEIDFFGKQELETRFDTCNACRQLTLLSSYTTGRFLQVRQFNYTMEHPRLLLNRWTRPAPPSR